MSAIDIEGWKEKLLRRSDSASSVEAGLKGYDAFRAFLSERNKIATDAQFSELISALKSGSGDVYRLLDEFVAYLKVKGRMPKTTENRVNAAKSFLRYQDVEILDEKFREKVTLPHVREIPDKPIKDEELRTLVNSASPLLRAVILTLASSGMRIGELSALRVQDLDFEIAKPAVAIRLRAETTKGDFDRTVFASDEAADALKAIIMGAGSKRAKELDDLVFFPRKEPKVKDANKLRDYYTDLLKKTGLAKQIEGHPYYNLHFHNLRKFFFSSMVRPLGETAVHGLMGHKKWWQVYDRTPIEQRASEYQEHMDKVYVLKTSPKIDPREQIITAIMSKGKSREQAEKIATAYETIELQAGRQPQWRKTTADIVIVDAAKQTEKKTVHDPQKVIAESELEAHLAQGWFYVSALPSGKIVVGRYE